MEHLYNNASPDDGLFWGIVIGQTMPFESAEAMLQDRLDFEVIQETVDAVDKLIDEDDYTLGHAVNHLLGIGIYASNSLNRKADLCAEARVSGEVIPIILDTSLPEVDSARHPAYLEVEGTRRIINKINVLTFPTYIMDIRSFSERQACSEDVAINILMRWGWQVRHSLRKNEAVLLVHHRDGTTDRQELTEDLEKPPG